MLKYFSDLYLGKKSLAFTWWVAGALTIGALKLIYILLAGYAGSHLSNASFLVLDFWFSIVILYSLFYCVCVINTVKSQEKRGFWANTAMVLAILGILVNISNVVVYVQYRKVNPLNELRIKFFKKAVDKMNKGLPKQIDYDKSLQSFSFLENELSLTTKYKLFIPNITTQIGLGFEKTQFKKELCGMVDELERFCSDCVEKYIFSYEANDGSKKEVSITEANCQYLKK
jgi:hypothetical protein